MSTCNMKGVVRSDEPAGTYRPVLQFLPILQLLFGFTVHNYCFKSVSPFSSALFPHTAVKKLR